MAFKMGKFWQGMALCVAMVGAAPAAQAAPLTFNLDGIELVQFLAATYGSELKRNYVLAPGLVGSSRKVSLHVTVERENLPAFLKDYTARMGIDTTEKDGVLYLSPSSGAPMAAAAPIVPAPAPLPQEFGPVNAAAPVQSVEPKEVEVYTPMHRPSAFLVTIANALQPGSAVAAGQRIVLSGTSEQIAKLTGLLEKLDVEAHRVTVNATFVEVSGNEGSVRGVGLVANVLGAKLGVSVGDTSSSTLSLRNTNFELVLNALNTDGRFKQVSAPRLIFDDEDQADLIVGNETPTITGVSLDRNGNPVQQNTYKPSGVILQVLPKVLGSGRIRLAVDAQVSSFQQTTTGVNASPTLIKRQVKGNVTVQDGEVIVMGGLSENRSVASSSGLPFLPASWSAKNSSSANTDLVLILSASAAR